jgi:GalNAc5-diNAcBac-PP-undecaprenol beta-1,3-glucosyltransferase
MARATVVIPTHDHADLLLRSVASAQRQSVADIEIFVIGDGVPERTREIMVDIRRSDPRVLFFDHPKGPRHGEVYRAAALEQAGGRIVCYLGDDDLWLPDHVACMERLLDDADFGHSMHLEAAQDGSLHAHLFDVALPLHRESMLQRNQPGFGLTFGAHTLAAYRRLPQGWRTAPPNIFTDLYMWQQFLGRDWCRSRSLMRPTALHFDSPSRRAWTLEQRGAELDRWVPRVAEPGASAALALMVLAEAAGYYGQVHPLLWDRDAAVARLAALENELAGLRGRHAATLQSRSWRWTAPLRRLTGAARRLATRRPG